MTMTPETVLDNLVFPECPRWHDDSLYFSDMHDGIVWRLTKAGASKVLEVPEYPAGLGWLPDGTMQVVSMLDRRVLRVTADGVITIADLSGGASPEATILLRGDTSGEVHVAAEGMLCRNGA